MSRDEPFVPIVRALTEQPLDSPAFLAAAGAASEVEARLAGAATASVAPSPTPTTGTPRNAHRSPPATPG